VYPYLVEAPSYMVGHPNIKKEMRSKFLVHSLKPDGIKRLSIASLHRDVHVISMARVSDGWDRYAKCQAMSGITTRRARTKRTFRRSRWGLKAKGKSHMGFTPYRLKNNHEDTKTMIEAPKP